MFIFKKRFEKCCCCGKGAFEKWSGATAYNRSQILYRIAEMMEGRKEQFIAELVSQGMEKNKANQEVMKSIDRVIYFPAGWSDKINQVFGSVNPVGHFKFFILRAHGCCWFNCT